MNKSRSSDLEENDIAKRPPIRCPSLPTPLKAFSPNAPCPSPPSKGAEERKLCGTRGTTQLKFGIDNILQPDFGRNSNERFSPPQFPAIPPEICCLSSMLPPSGLHSHELLPSWIFCTRYSDRPSSGPRIRKIKRREFSEEEKRPRTAFTADQLERLKSQFLNNRYLTEKRRQELAHELGLNESQIKIWFQNKRAKLKKSSQRAHQSAAVLHQFMANGGGGGIYQQK